MKKLLKLPRLLKQQFLPPKEDKILHRPGAVMKRSKMLRQMQSNSLSECIGFVRALRCSLLSHHNALYF